MSNRSRFSLPVQQSTSGGGQMVRLLANRQAVLELFATCNALALCLALARVDRLDQLQWSTLWQLGLFVNWIVLAFVLLVHWLQRKWTGLSRQGVFLRCLLVLLAVLAVNSSMAGIWQQAALHQPVSSVWPQVAHHTLLGGVLGLICLRYLYVREQVIARERAELQARVQALQARIQPHFLFNSLNSVVSLIAIDPLRAEQMLINLSQLFRASLNELRQVPLQEELELCRRYLQIESVRLGDRLQVDWRIEGEELLSSAPIPLLTLQPLLENCIYHGVESLQAHSVVTILLELRPGQVTIVLTNPYSPGQQRCGHGMAQDNIRQRLQACYGTQVQFKTFGHDGRFTTFLSYRY